MRRVAAGVQPVLQSRALPLKVSNLRAHSFFLLHRHPPHISMQVMVRAQNTVFLGAEVKDTNLENFQCEHTLTLRLLIPNSVQAGWDGALHALYASGCSAWRSMPFRVVWPLCAPWGVSTESLLLT